VQIVDYKLQLKKFYRPSEGPVELVDVPPFNVIQVDGQGDPTTKEYQDAVQALIAVANALKLTVKKSDSIDYGVMPLECLWWGDDASRFTLERKADWKWTLMIHQPSMVMRKVFDKALADAKAKIKTDLPGLDRMRFESFKEGRAAQKLHVGPFTEQGPAVQAVHDRIQAIGGKVSGKHHEIYLSDVAKASPDKWKTIIRQPYI
jgi:hypothetical protein